MSRQLNRNIIAFILFLVALPGLASAATTYLDETAFLNDFGTMIPGSYTTLQEGFENDTVWGAARTPAGATSITSQGIIWETNQQDAVNASLITTGTGPARTGFWGVFSSPHGNPDREMDTTICDVDLVPSACLMHDGFSGASAAGETIYAIGFWFSGTPISTVSVYLDGVKQATDILAADIPQFMGVIDPAGFTSFEVRELEGKTGNEKLIFADDFTLAGSFSPQPSIGASPQNVVFGSVTTGNTADLTITMTNNGNADLTISDIGLVDALSAPFSLISGQDNCSNQVVTPSSHCTLAIRYSPSSVGNHFDSFDVPSDDPATPTIIIEVSGTGAAAPVPDITPSTTSLLFGSVTVGSSADKLLTLTNTGNDDLIIADIGVVDALAAPFSLVAGQDNCSNMSLLPAASCTVAVRYSPSTEGLQGDSFNVPSDDPDTPTVTVNVSGTGTPVANPAITVSSTALQFGSVTLGNTTDLTLTLGNTGNADLTISDIGLANALSAPFSLVSGQDNCSNQILTPSSGCTIAVRYSPTSEGIQIDSFDVPSDDPDTPTVTVDVSGTGTQVLVPNIMLSATSFLFGSVTVGDSVDQTLTLSNSGNAELTISVIGFVNDLAAPFSLVQGQDNCSNSTLAPAASCMVTIRYSPAAEGPLNDSFDIPSDDPDTPTVTVSVSGTGTPTPVPNIVLSDTPLLFGDITAGTTTDQTLTISNTGNANLTISEIALSNPLAAPFELLSPQDSCSHKTLVPKTSCTVTFRFSPLAEGPLNDSFDIPSNDPDTPTVTVSVSGTGTPAIVNSPPVQPTLIYPANQQAGLPTAFAFRWNKTTDPEKNPITYDLFYCEDITFQGCLPVEIVALGDLQKRYLYAGGSGLWMVMMAGLLSLRKKRARTIMIVCVFISGILLLSSCGGGGGGSTAVAPTNEISHSVSGLKQNTTYYWKVSATDGIDSSESETRSFNTL